MTKKTNKIPNDHHVIRYIPWSKLRRDDNNEVIGILGAAFQLRPSENALSTTWIEYFSGSYEEQVTASINAIRQSKIEVKSKSGFAIGQVGAIQYCCQSLNYKVKVLHKPEDDNEAHSEVMSLPRDDLQLLELLAVEAWSDLRMTKSYPSS